MTTKPSLRTQAVRFPLRRGSNRSASIRTFFFAVRMHAAVVNHLFYPVSRLSCVPLSSESLSPDASPIKDIAMHKDMNPFQRSRPLGRKRFVSRCSSCLRSFFSLYASFATR